MPDLNLFTPDRIDQALEEYASNPEAGIFAGGTDLMVLLKDRLATPDRLISLAGIKELGRIESGPAGWEIGPAVGLWELERHDALLRDFPALAEAIRAMAAPPIRNAATIGGNLCLDVKCIYYNQSHGWPRSLADCLKAGGEVCHVAPAGKRCWGALAADTVGPMMVSGAEVTLASKNEQRTIPLEAFFSGEGLAPHDLKPGEILTRVSLPGPRPRTGQAYARFAFRQAIDFPVINLTASVEVDQGGEVAALELILGAVCPAPVRLGESLRELIGLELNQDVLAPACSDLGKAAVRISKSPRLTKFLQEVVAALAQRVLAQAYRRAKAHDPAKGGNHE